ncbi:hypothetical protein QQG09_08070 [Melissococcus plutonius]|uniref:Uncharacterized protein n=2 Tax=Melissococcus plutonius TaxID=33970 RepID=F3YBN6_MELPT|nr:hypothetical protein [Melissococcus plutonius]BAL61807.1 hypothetical protein MPD5_0538 [Melissococcus plutonius DAT561]AIM25889.1 hypothetical protein MEPL_c013630 [Melissococcus plutonius S1]KMT23882.1 hypothetical protein MEPL2_3c00850 [Melissococcus plutonius]KMT24405.1 hypothetical protein MEPL3_6c00850 [Melissococcus plutonius]KMT25978.1 hypothetical protein MEPL1_6c00850 [Melissococcus plutonius]
MIIKLRPNNSFKQRKDEKNNNFFDEFDAEYMEYLRKKAIYSQEHIEKKGLPKD